MPIAIIRKFNEVLNLFDLRELKAIEMFSSDADDISLVFDIAPKLNK